MKFLFDRNQEALPYFDGVMKPNNKLQEVTKINPGKLPGPESIQIDRYGMYSSLLFTNTNFDTFASCLHLFIGKTLFLALKLL